MPRKNLTCPKYFSNVCQINLTKRVRKVTSQDHQIFRLRHAKANSFPRQILRGYDNVEHQNSQSNPRRSLFAKKCSYAPLQFTLYVAFVRALGPRRLEKYEAEEPDMLLHGAMASCKNLLLAKVWCARCCFYRVLGNIFSLSRRLCFCVPTHQITSLGVVS